MNKEELVKKIAESADITRAKAEETLKAIIGGIKKALKEGEKVTLIGLGSFSVVERKARNGRHPKTGKKIKIAASKVAKFRAGKELKNLLNG